MFVILKLLLRMFIEESTEICAQNYFSEYFLISNLRESGADQKKRYLNKIAFVT